MARRSTKKKIKEALPSLEDVRGPSPDPHTNLLLADVALRGGGALLRRSIEKGFLGQKYSPRKAKQIIKGRTMAETLIGTAIAKIATRSVPGAILVTGSLLAKTLYDRKKGAQAAIDGDSKLDEMAAEGEGQDGWIHES